MITEQLILFRLIFILIEAVPLTCLFLTVKRENDPDYDPGYQRLIALYLISLFLLSCCICR